MSAIAFNVRYLPERTVAANALRICECDASDTRSWPPFERSLAQ